MAPGGHWHDAAWQRRYPAAILAQSSGGGALDVQFVIPRGWDRFWENVDATGKDVRVALPGEAAFLTYKLEVWDHAARQGTVHVEGVLVDGSSIGMMWLYWDNPDAVDDQGTFTVSTPLTASITLMAPRDPLSTDPTEPGAETPGQERAKAVGEEIFYWWDVGPRLAEAVSSLNGRRRIGALRKIDVDSATGPYQGGTLQSAMLGGFYGFSQDEEGLYAGFSVKDGTDGQSYTLRLVFQSEIVQSAIFEKLEAFALLRVNTPSE